MGKKRSVKSEEDKKKKDEELEEELELDDEDDEDEELEDEEEVEEKDKKKKRKRRTVTKKSANDEDFYSRTLGFMCKLSGYLYTMKETVRQIKEFQSELESNSDKWRWLVIYAFGQMIKFEDEKELFEKYLSTTRSSTYKSIVEKSYEEHVVEYKRLRSQLNEMKER